jgi:hypothetical protein
METVVTQTERAKVTASASRTAAIVAPPPNAGPNNFGDVNSNDGVTGIVAGVSAGVVVVAALAAAVFRFRTRSRDVVPSEEEEMNEVMAHPAAAICTVDVEFFASEYGFSDQHHAHQRSPDSDEELVVREIEQAGREHDSDEHWADDVGLDSDE